MQTAFRRLAGIVLLGFSLIVSAFASAAAPPVEIKAARVLMVEAETGTVLLARNENAVFTPASLAKLMTVEVVLAALAGNELAPDTLFPVSEYAWRTGGAPSRTSTMFAALKSQITVDDLLSGVIVHNANDGCIILAEGMSGSDAAFAARMTRRAGELGMKNTTFGNSTGLPDPANRTTARDMMVLARHLQGTYPERYKLFSKPDFEWNRIFQRNKNPLLSLNAGIDGMALGFSEDSGYGVVASVERDGRRLFLVMSGLPTDKERTEETRKILDWGLSSFTMRQIFDRDEAVGKASVYGGAVSEVDLVPDAPVNIYVPVDNPDRLSARIVYRWPLMAPVAAGLEVGTLSIHSGDTLLREVPLKTAKAVEEGSLTARAGDALMELLFSWL